MSNNTPGKRTIQRMKPMMDKISNSRLRKEIQQIQQLQQQSGSSRSKRKNAGTTSAFFDFEIDFSVPTETSSVEDASPALPSQTFSDVEEEDTEILLEEDEHNVTFDEETEPSFSSSLDADTTTSSSVNDSSLTFSCLSKETQAFEGYGGLLKLDKHFELGSAILDETNTEWSFRINDNLTCGQLALLLLQIKVTNKCSDETLTSFIKVVWSHNTLI